MSISVRFASRHVWSTWGAGMSVCDCVSVEGLGGGIWARMMGRVTGVSFST